MTEELAIRWYEAERAKEHTHWENLPERRKDEIRKRVKLVLEGEVRRSECSPGDLAVWLGRFRSPLKSPPEWFTEVTEEEPARHKIVRLRSLVFYDCLELDKSTNRVHHRLFGNAHVGNYALSNVQVAGMLSNYDGSFLIHTVWVGLALDEELSRILHELLVHATVTIVVGDRPQFVLSAYELWKDPHPVEICIPIRQTFGVEVEFYGAKNHDDKPAEMALDKLKEKLRKHDPERAAPRLYVNVEGWQRRYVM